MRRGKMKRTGRQSIPAISPFGSLCEKLEDRQLGGVGPADRNSSSGTRGADRPSTFRREAPSRLEVLGISFQNVATKSGPILIEERCRVAEHLDVVASFALGWKVGADRVTRSVQLPGSISPPSRATILPPGS